MRAMLSSKERREFQRLQLERPLSGIFEGREVTILEIGVLGARISHAEPIEPGTSGLLRFDWDTTSVALESEVVRTAAGAPSPEGQTTIHQSGMRFTTAIGESDSTLRRMLATRVREILEERSPGLAQTDVTADEDTATGRNAPFVTYYMLDGEWHKKPSVSREQPDSGFTVAKGESEIEIKLLRQVYENADTEGMYLIRLFAELSISEALGIPKRGDARDPS